MKTTIPQEHLANIIRENGQRWKELQQVCHRVEELLPERLMGLKLSLAGSAKGSAALRQALCHSQYNSHLEEVADLKRECLSAKIQFETHLMLHQARTSLRKH